MVRELLALRRREISPRLAGAAFGDAHASDDGLLTASWRMGDGARLLLSANLSNTALARGPDETTGAAIWGGEAGDLVPPWSVFWRLEAR
jgi:maltooligosyltrehalose trehalohydrolase